MKYALLINGTYYVGLFDTHIAATVFAEQNGCDDYTMIKVWNPALLLGIVRRMSWVVKPAPVLYLLNTNV